MKKNLDIEFLLIRLNADMDFRQWCGVKPIEEIWATCPRGDWMLWLLENLTTSVDVRLMTTVKAKIANTVRVLMKDPRSIAAVDIAMKYGEGLASKDDLQITNKDVYHAAAMPNNTYKYEYAYAAYAADKATDNSQYLAASNCALNAASAVGYAYGEDAKYQNQKLTADICREHLPISLLLD